MEGSIKDNGGISTTLGDSSATHIIVDDKTVLEKPSNCPEKALVVKAEWFSASIQTNSCVSEHQYLFNSNVASFLSPPSHVFSPGTPGTLSKRRKRLRETVQQQAENDSTSGLPTTFSSSRKRFSSVGNLAFFSSDGSFLEDSLQSFLTPCYNKTPFIPPSFDSRLLPSRQGISTVRVAIDVCNNTELKKEIFCAPVSNYEIDRRNWFYRKKLWGVRIEKKTSVILENLGIAKQLQEKVMGVVLLVGMRMLTWAEYHEGTLGFSREYSVKFLNDSFFTQQGIIDNKKAAEELMKDQSLNIKQKYKLACLYCFTEHIPTLFRQMTKEDKKKFYDARKPHRIMQPELVKFWSYYLMGEIDKLKEEESLDQYRLEKAVKSGSKAAVEYCLEIANLKKKKDAIIDFAMETVRIRIIRGSSASPTSMKNFENDWVVFCDERYNDSESSWVPSDYYIDILHSLLSKMRDDQKIEFLKKEIECVTYRNDLKNHRHSRTLEYFLNWPYQDYFMKTAALMWEFLPERSYADLLLNICNRIEPKKENLRYGEEKSFDYRKLLKEFWNQSPEHFKSYVFSDKEITYVKHYKKILNEGKELLVKLFSLENFTYEDRKIIELILADATNTERENIIFSQEGKNICIGLMKEEKWEILHEFVSNIFPSEGQAKKFKREFTFAEKSQRICLDFVKNDKWDSAESFIKWSALLEEENKFKKEMICSENGLRACVDLISCDKKVEVVDRFIRWCFPSAEEMKTFKKELVLSCSGIWKCEELVTGDEVELADEFINFGSSSEKEIRELKKNVAYSSGISVCKTLISEYSEENIYDERSCGIGTIVDFRGGKWEVVEKFLTWCFSTEEEISEFKRKIFEKLGIDIHSSLIAARKWEDAEIFYAWLGLSAKEIRNLKKETLLSVYEMENINYLIHARSLGNFLGYAWGKWEEIEMYLRWCLIDKEAVLEFKDRFDEKYGFKSYEKEEEETPKDKRVILNEFYLLIEELFNNLSQCNLTTAFSGNI